MYDVVIIGGGIVGTSIFRSLQIGKGNLKCCLVEKNEQLATGSSGGNSAILHEIVEEDHSKNPLEHEILSESVKLAQTFFKVSQLPHRYCGALFVAWNSDQLAHL